MEFKERKSLIVKLGPDDSYRLNNILQYYWKEKGIKSLSNVIRSMIVERHEALPAEFK